MPRHFRPAVTRRRGFNRTDAVYLATDDVARLEENLRTHADAPGPASISSRIVAQGQSSVGSGTIPSS